MVGAVAAFALASCTSIEEQDSDFVNSLDETKPALVVFAQSINTISHSTGALVAALNFNEYLNAPEETKEIVEDEYYKYMKIRHSGELWRIYNERWNEKYRLNNSLSLSDEGAEWDIISSPYFFGNEEQDKAISVERVDKDIFVIRLTKAKIPVFAQWYNLGERCNAIIDAELRVATNDTEQRAIGKSEFTYNVSGSGRFYDSEYETYSVHFTINTPIEITHRNDGAFIPPCVGDMDITVSQGQYSEYVSATMSPYNAIMLQYKTMGETYTGYYNWSLNNISPR